MKYSDKIKNEAKKLFMKNLSLDDICKQLKATYKRACKSLHRSTIQTWAKADNWEAAKAAIVKKAIAKSKIPDIENAKDIEEVLTEYHAENYKFDSELRRITHKKLKDFLQKTPIDFATVKIFIDVYRISTAAMIKLFEITRDDKDTEPLLDDLLKMRAEKQNLTYIPPERNR